MMIRLNLNCDIEDGCKRSKDKTNHHHCFVRVICKVAIIVKSIIILMIIIIFSAQHRNI